MKKLFYLTIATIAFLLSVKIVAADYGCAPYGGECPVSSQLVVDKQIKDPRAKGDIYVDNLLLSDYSYSPGEDVIFKITVKNTGNTTVNSIVAYDTVPYVLNYVLLSGDARESIRELTRTIGSLSAGETRSWFIRMRVKSANQLPGGISCGDPQAINRAKVSADNMSDTYDTSVFCVQKEILGVTSQPESGSEIMIIAAGLIAFAGIGFAGQKFLAHS